MPRPCSRTALLIAAAMLPGCGAGSVSLPDEPIRLPDPLPCSARTPWQISGFAESDFVAGALVLPLGRGRQLFVYEGPSLGGGGCTDEQIASIRWVSTRPDVAGGFEPGAGKRWAWLTGRALGETMVSAEVVLAGGATVTAPLTWRGAPSPVRVVAAAPPPGGRSVLLEGEVGLEPEKQGAYREARAYLVFQSTAAGTLDIVVDWRSPSNRVIVHLCPGEVAFPQGCVPLIDGTRYRDHKPVVASAKANPGPHTLWISNSGPGRETVSYEVGLVPE
jgi:hypothetical protein